MLSGKSQTKEKKKPTFKSTVFNLLCEVIYYEDKREDISPANRVAADHPFARSVGRPYKEILRKAKRRFPQFKPTIKDIRRYAILIRRGEAPGMRLAQRRPRPNQE